MPASPADIARFTTDGVVVTTDAAAGAAVLAAHPNAREIEEGQEIEMFFVDPAHAQAMLDERFELQSIGGPLHDGVELENGPGIAEVLSAPVVPSFTVADDDGRQIDVRAAAYARNMRIDRHAIEVIE